ncbi:MAG: family N-acetyltransferase [Sphingobacterium sp.]|jgi:ribosomal-protein-alanine N-acetyltransferase|nr:family N-acetyltransferase [Sphingobacterium sp.]
MGVVRCNDEIDCAHIGYCIGKQWWNKGIISEAFAAVIEFLFYEVGVNRIESRHDTKNPNSGKVMIKCVLQYEGTLRESDINNQGICDAAWYSLLKRDYYKK